MDHSMHMAHGHGQGDMDMDMGQCNMNMVFTWSAKDLCIIFRQWRITGPFSFLLSLVVIVILTAGYEWVRGITRRYEAAHYQRLNTFATTTTTAGDDEVANTAAAHVPASEIYNRNERSPLIAGSDRRVALARQGRVILAALYAAQVFYSFFIMLLFMTYNGMIMIAVAVGAFVGYLVFADDAPASKTVACH